MEGCFMFQWVGGCFSDGASFFSGEGRPMGTASVLIGGVFRKKSCRVGGGGASP